MLPKVEKELHEWGKLELQIDQHASYCMDQFLGNQKIIEPKSLHIPALSQTIQLLERFGQLYNLELTEINKEIERKRNEAEMRIAKLYKTEKWKKYLEKISSNGINLLERQ